MHVFIRVIHAQMAKMISGIYTASYTLLVSDTRDLAAGQSDWHVHLAHQSCVPSSVSMHYPRSSTKVSRKT